jgi:hypothetical protein
VFFIDKKPRNGFRDPARSAVSQYSTVAAQRRTARKIFLCFQIMRDYFIVYLKDIQCEVCSLVMIKVIGAKIFQGIINKQNFTSSKRLASWNSPVLCIPVSTDVFGSTTVIFKPK